MDKSLGLVFQKCTRDFTHLQLMKNGITANFAKRYSEIEISGVWQVTASFFLFLFQLQAVDISCLLSTPKDCYIYTDTEYSHTYVPYCIAQSCVTLCDPMDYSPPDSSVHGISQARILEWVAIPFCKGSSQPREQTWVSCIAGRFFTIFAIL